jgi:transcriptional regulator with XRE-family HTH domain
MKDYNFGLEYEITVELIQARINAGLTQEEIAIRMGTTQSAIARLKSGRVLPSVKILTQYTKATGKHLHISLEA